MKSRSEIWHRSLEELGEQCSVSTQRSAETVALRSSREGDSFFTITLPAFGKAFEQALALRAIPHDLFTGWGRNALRVTWADPVWSIPRREGDAPDTTIVHGCGTPKFLGEFLGLVFSNELVVPRAGSEIGALPKLEPYIALSRGDEGFDRQVAAVAAVRQLTLMFGKEKRACTPARTDAAFERYKEVDQELDNPLF